MSDLDAFLNAQGDAFVRKLRAKKPRQPSEPKPKKRATPERDAQRAVVAWLRKAGCIVQGSFVDQGAHERDPGKRARFGQARKLSGATTGYPDLTVTAPDGRTFWVEMKSATGKLSPAQTELHAAMRARGCVVVVGRDVWSVQDALAQQGVTIGRGTAA